MEHRPAHANRSIVYCSYPRRDTSQAKASSRQATCISSKWKKSAYCARMLKYSSTSDNIHLVVEANKPKWCVP
jgi:hypothetical protein